MTEKISLDPSKLETTILKYKMEKSVIILGVMHHNKRECRCYENLIEKINPSCILYEAYDEINNEILDCYNSEFQFQSWANNHKYRFIRCDLIHIDGVPNDERERRMREIIIEHLNDKPIIVIIGHTHAAECSNIHRLLQEKTDYIVIWKTINACNKFCNNCGTEVNINSEEESCPVCDSYLYNIKVYSKTGYPAGRFKVSARLQ